MTDITLSTVADFAELGVRWRALESRADGSFFQGWTWTGCLAAERFPDPVLVEARRDGETVALALFNRLRGRWGAETLFLGESGVAALDCPYIEHNGVLTATGSDPGLAAACLKAARGAPLGGKRPALTRRLMLRGIDDATLAAARQACRSVRVEVSRPAPFADLAAVRQEGADYLAGRSANARQQIRRSDRAYAALGALRIDRAETAQEAHALLDSMTVLHQATWTGRGQPGSFAEPFFGRFHHALIDRGMPRGEIDLLRMTAGGQTVGILYNFRCRGRALAYQSGFDYGSAGRHQKPGLTSHHLAIQQYLAAGIDSYDFLAGDGRYKRSLADGEVTMHWVACGMVWPPRRIWQ